LTDTPKTHPPGQSGNPIIEFFDRRAADYDREYAEDTPGGHALRVRRKKVLDLFDQQGGLVLDVGCGPGVMTQELLDRGCRFCGVDPSSKMIEIARSRFTEDERTRFVQGDASRLEFADNAFDAVLCMGVIDSVPDGRLAVQEMVRVLKPGGTLILTVGNLLSPYAWWKNYAFYPIVAAWHRLRVRLGDPTLTPGRIRSGSLRTLYSRTEARHLVENAQATLLEIVPYYFNVFISPLDELMPGPALRVTQKLEDAVWARPDWIAVGWILKARKV
jgi:ubiquinone/menaquinone biosynthesis C-methylase UbiE